jgi:hypothetical protein
VAEVRALRAEMKQTADASLRAQLLVARLQVEEQRIAGLARQLSETEQQMRALEGARNPMLEQMIKQFDQEPREAGEPDMFAGIRAQLEKIQNGDPVLNERQASLSRQLADEQARWVAFNAQLEALEKRSEELLIADCRLSIEINQQSARQSKSPIAVAATPCFRQAKMSR